MSQSASVLLRLLYQLKNYYKTHRIKTKLVNILKVKKLLLLFHKYNVQKIDR